MKLRHLSEEEDEEELKMILVSSQELEIGDVFQLYQMAKKITE